MLWTDAEARYAARPAVDTKQRALTFPPDRHFVTAEELGAFTAARRIELPTLELHGDTDGDASCASRSTTCACSARSSITRARSATPSTSSR